MKSPNTPFDIEGPPADRLIAHKERAFLQRVIQGLIAIADDDIAAIPAERTNGHSQPYSIYTITHKRTGRTYVGMTSSTRPRSRLSAQKIRSRVRRGEELALAIHTEGVSKFDFKIVATAANYFEAGMIERRLIKEFRATDAGVYNKDPGGSGCRPKSHALTLDPPPMEKLGRRILADYSIANVIDLIATLQAGVAPAHHQRTPR